MAESKTVQGVPRTVNVALASFDLPNGVRAHGFMGQTVMVHPDSVARFDELNRPPRFTPDPDASRGGVVDVNARRAPTAAEQRIVDGFGPDPITVAAQTVILADGERQDDAAAAAEA